MSTLFESQTVQDGSLGTSSTTEWLGQTFTPQTTHSITSVKLRGSSRMNSRPPFDPGDHGDITVSIRAVDSNDLPSGSDLASGTYTPLLPLSDVLFEVTFDTPTVLNAGTRYAIVMRVASFVGDTVVLFRETDDGETEYYANGAAMRSTNSGVSWTEQNEFEDFYFEDWGGPVTGPKTGADSGFGLVDVNGATVVMTAHVSEITGLPGRRNVEEQTSIRDAGTNFVPGIEDVQFEIKGMFEDVTADPALGLLRTHGTARGFDFGPSGRDTGDIKYSGNCRMLAYEILGRIGRAVSYRARFKVEGGVTRGTY